MEKISVIIVSWNVLDSLKRCLASLKATGYPHLEIIVIDNASTDGSDKLATIKNSENIGFPKAVNMGLKKATGEYLVLLNPDTILPKDFFTKSLEFLKSHPDAGLVGPQFENQASIYNEPSVLNAIREYWLGQKDTYEKYLLPAVTTVDCVTFACVIFPRSTLERIGFLTEKVFMYYEDLDYCRRVRAAGLKVYYDPEIVISHEHGSSAKSNPKVNNYLIASSKWYNGLIKYYLLTFILWSGQKIKYLLQLR